MLERPIPNNLYGKQQLPPNRQTRKWLIWLAQQMQRGSRVELMIEKMHPSWLQAEDLSSYRMHYWLVLGLIFGLWNGLLGGLAMWLNSAPMLSISVSLCDGITSGLSSGFILGLTSKNKIRSTKTRS